MNLQHLKHFVAVAEELHFSRAAERLGMAQPPLSQSIKRLEGSLGCTLFVRAQRGVKLTAAGETLLRHAPEILNLVEYARRSTIASGQIGVSKLTIGFTPNALNDAVAKILSELDRLVPSVEVSLVEGTSVRFIEQLLTGEVDIAFIPEQLVKPRGLEARLITKNEHVAAVPEGSPLAAKDELWLRDLADVKLILVPEPSRPDYRTTIVTALREAGVTPRISQEAVFDHTRLRMVAAGLGVTFVSPTAAPLGFPGVTLKRVVDMPIIKFGLWVVWRSPTSAKARKIFESIYALVKNDLKADQVKPPSGHG